MNNKINELVNEIKEVRESANPVKEAWVDSCEKVGLDMNDPMVHFGLMFTKHPDLISSPNSYHNQVHAADAVTCAGALAKEEFSGKDLKFNGPVLLFSMLCHDIAHNGKNNEFDYQLEKEAVNSMTEFANKNPEIKKYWKDNLETKYGSLDGFFNNVEQVILGTDFKNGPKENLKNYSEQNFGELKLNQLKMLANEADILPSCISSLGPQLGLQLAEEQNNPGVASWKGREFFIGKLATFGSNASKNMEIQNHIDSQLRVIAKHGAESLDQESKNGNFLNVADKVHKESTAPFKLNFNLDILREMRDSFLKGTSNLKYK